MHATSRLLAVLALAALLGALVLLLGGFGDAAPPPGALRPVAQSTGEAAPERAPPAAAATALHAERSEAPEARAPRSATAAPSPLRMLRGRVLDARGTPVAAVPLELHAFSFAHDPVGALVPGVATTSDAFGAFAFEPVDAAAVVPVAGAGFCTLRTTARLAGVADEELIVVVAPSVTLRGFVHDAAGAPLVDVRAVVMTFVLAEFPLPLERTVSLPSPAATTDADGRFSLAEVALAPGVDLAFTLAGYRQRRLPSTEAAAGFVDVLLEREVEGSGLVTGLVLDGGRPVADVALRYGFRQEARSGADGSFSFALERRPQRLVATRPGRLRVVRDGVGRDTPMPLVLEFTGPCLAIEGRVVDGQGAPLAGIRLNLVDPERAGSSATVERLSAAPDPDLPRGVRARSAADGTFRIDGLADRSYRLRAWDERTAVAIESPPVPAGSTGVVLTMPDDALLGELGGIVVTRDGVGVPGAIVSVHLVADRYDDVVIVPGPSTKTGDDGRFTLRDLPRQHVLLAVLGDELVYTQHPIEQLTAMAEVRLEVLRRVHVQVEGEPGTWLRFLDAGGEALQVTVQSRGQTQGGNGWSLAGAKSPVIGVAETAVTLVWMKNGEELGRKPISLPSLGDGVVLLSTLR